MTPQNPLQRVFIVLKKTNKYVQNSYLHSPEPIFDALVLSSKSAAGSDGASSFGRIIVAFVAFVSISPFDIDDGETLSEKFCVPELCKTEMGKDKTITELHWWGSQNSGF